MLQYWMQCQTRHSHQVVGSGHTTDLFTHVQRKAMILYVHSRLCHKDSALVYDIHGLNGCPLISTTYTGWKEVANEECMVVVLPLVREWRSDEMIMYMYVVIFQPPNQLTDSLSLSHKHLVVCIIFNVPQSGQYQEKRVIWFLLCFSWCYQGPKDITQ